MATAKPKETPAAVAATPTPVVATAAPTEVVTAATGAPLQDQLTQELRNQLDAAVQKLATANQELEDERDAHAATTAERDDLSEQLDDATDTITELNRQLTKAQAQEGGQGGARTVEHEGKAYTVKLPRFTLLDGRDYLAADVTTGSDVLAHLVKIGSGVLEEVTD